MCSQTVAGWHTGCFPKGLPESYTIAFMRLMMTTIARGFILVSLISFPGLAGASHDLPERLRHEAQVQSNNGHYTQAQQLRTIADSLKKQDASTVRQVQTEIGKGNIDKAMDLLKAR
jgi:hypothetical protein